MDLGSVLFVQEATSAAAPPPNEFYIKLINLLWEPMQILIRYVAQLGMFIIHMGLVLYVMSYMMKNVLDGPMGNRQNSKKARKIMDKRGLKPRPRLSKYEQQIAGKLIDPDDINIGWDDIGGLDNIVVQVQNNIISPLIARKSNFHVSKYARPPQGVLFHGPPGCGKTTLAKAIAKESGCLFINLEASDLVDKFFGESEKLTSATFSLATKLSPCIIFLDEIDSLLRSRCGRDHEVTANMKSLFMSLWDGLATDDSKTVIVMGATNLPGSVDPAILRRMSSKFHIPLPDTAQRKCILEILLEEERLAHDVNIQQLATITEGFSGSDLKEIVRNASVSVLSADLGKRGRNLILNEIYKDTTTAKEKSSGPLRRVLNILLGLEVSSKSEIDVKKHERSKPPKCAIKMEDFESAVKAGKDSRTETIHNPSQTPPNAAIRVDVNFNLNHSSAPPS